MTKRAIATIGVALLSLASIVEAAAPREFFAYCVGYGVGKEAFALAEQLKLPAMLAETGCDGMAWVGLAGAEEMMAALEKKGRKLYAVYTPLIVDEGANPYDPALDALIPKLAGHGTVVWLVVNSSQHKPSSTGADRRAVELLRKIADLAAQHGVAVSLYPHRGAYAERMEDVVRLVQKAERPNLGVTFTFCHFLAVDKAENLERVLQLSRPHLTMAVINGTDGYDPQNRAGWIQTIDQGSYDLRQVLAAFDAVDFRGPVGFIAFGIKEPPRQILQRSMTAWKQLHAPADRPAQ